MKFLKFTGNVLILLLISASCIYEMHEIDIQGVPSHMVTELRNGGVWELPQEPRERVAKLTSGIAIVESFDGKMIFEKSLDEIADAWGYAGMYQNLKIKVGHHSLDARFFVTHKAYEEIDGGLRTKETTTYNLSLPRTLSFDAEADKQYLLLAFGPSNVMDPDWEDACYIWIHEVINGLFGKVVAGTAPKHFEKAIQQRNETYLEMYKKKGD